MHKLSIVNSCTSQITAKTMVIEKLTMPTRRYSTLESFLNSVHQKCWIPEWVPTLINGPNLETLGIIQGQLLIALKLFTQELDLKERISQCTKGFTRNTVFMTNINKREST